MATVRSVSVSAPGKCILHGEHAVVYGKEALAAALDLRTSATLRPADAGVIRLVMPALDIDVQLEAAALPPGLADAGKLDLPPRATEEYVAALAAMVGAATEADGALPARALAMVTFLYLYDAARRIDGALANAGVALEVTSQLPIGAGLGSSAAFCVCLSASLLGAFGHVAADGGLSDADRAIVNTWALHGEKVVHGNPSGLDNTMSVYGGAVTYTGGRFSPLENFPALRVLLVNTKVPRSTRALVAGVGVLNDKFPAVMGPVLDSVGQVSAEARARYSQLGQAQASNDTEAVARLESELVDLIVLNQRLLATMGVSHRSLEKVVAIAEDHGVPAKLTGAGGGGCALVYLPQATGEPAAALQAALKVEGYDTWLTALGAEGVLLAVE